MLETLERMCPSVLEGRSLTPEPEPTVLTEATELLNYRPSWKWIQVEYLRSVQTYDPFLLVRDHHGNRFYMEVWNEPKYKQERMV